MLEFHLGSIEEKVVLTLNELQTIPTPHYLFLFEHITTKEIVSFVYFYTNDESAFPYRYNLFTINMGVFLNKAPGDWNYTIYEQISATNTDPGLTTGVLEYGKMILYKVDEFEFSKYNEPVTYQAYNG